ncbi:MAG: hypothetical protein U1F61_30695 [Opitutaceae bacterium]
MTPLEHFEAKERVLKPIVELAMATVRQEVSSRQPIIRESFFYGAMGVDPKHLVIWYIFNSEGEIAIARRTGLLGDLDAQSRLALRTEGYPEQAIGLIQVSFASDEAIRRAGGFRAFFA